jgi:hypothetical protein
VDRVGARQILDAWERGLDESPARRALTVLEVLAPDAADRGPAQLTAGARDTALIAAHLELFGSTLDAVGECPQCGEQVELEVDAEALSNMADPEPTAATNAPETLNIKIDDLELTLHRLTAGDLVLAEAAPDTAAAHDVLVERCVVHATRKGKPVSTRRLPEGALTAVSDALEAADPAADLQLALSCPGCGHEWEEPLDVGAFVWREVEARAHFLLREVDMLARTYGWTEPEVLRLTPRRRALYAELAEA